MSATPPRRRTGRRRPASLGRLYRDLGGGRLRLWRVTLDADPWKPADAAGRWSRSGTPIVYASSAAALAVLEARAHLEAKDARRIHRLAWLEMELAAGVAQCIDCERLPANWKRRKALTRDVGEHWLQAGQAMVLLVPSALVAGEMNVLLNANHRHWPRCRRAACDSAFRFDYRLV